MVKFAICHKDPQVTYMYKQCTNNMYCTCESHAGALWEYFCKRKVCERVCYLASFHIWKVWLPGKFEKLNIQLHRACESHLQDFP
jgi:hypothetical protein